MSKKLNGFNNGRDTTDGIGGKPPFDCDKIEGVEINSSPIIKIGDCASFARSQAEKFIDWQRSDECPYMYAEDKRWRNIHNNFEILTTPELYSQFLDHQKKQQEGKGE